MRAYVPDGFAGLYLFRTLSDLLANKPAYFQQAFGNPDTNSPVNRYAGFAQDHWTLNSKLTLEFGLRQFPQILAERDDAAAIRTQ